MSALDIFTYGETRLRTLTVGGDPWFIAADVAYILGLDNVSQALAGLDDDEKSSITITDGTPGNPTRSTINEPGLYSLILRSRRPEAKAFKRWVAHEVLPSIRKTGSYSTTPAIDLTSPAGILALAEKFTETARALVAVTARAEVAEEFKEAIELNDGRTQPRRQPEAA